MRCMTLAIAFSALGWIALDTRINADETSALKREAVEMPTIGLSSPLNSRPTYFALAANPEVGEVSSPSDLAQQQSELDVLRGNARTQTPPSTMIPSADLSNMHGYRPPMPFGPSGIPSILQYLTCDPYSCPNIWQGHEAQRAAELAKKCSAGCGHCGGVGCGCGRTNMYSSPCVTCASPTIKLLNRYRAAPALASCSSCGNSACDGLNSSCDDTNGCSSCQAASKMVRSDRISTMPIPTAR